MQSSTQILGTFNTITLAEMEGVELMNRKDVKYFFEAHKLPAILSALQEHYKVLHINNCRVFHYNNIYFDTPDFFCYYQHHNQRINRYKIRIRQYVESNLNFLEVKFKTNTKRTVKTRMKLPAFTDTFTEDAKAFLRKQTPFNPDVLQPVLRNDFERFTIVSNDLKERATIDNELVLMAKNESIRFNKLCIAELKHDTSSSGSRFKIVMRDNFCPEMRISKYSVGAAYLYENLKQNNWKPKKLRINRIEHEH